MPPRCWCCVSTAPTSCGSGLPPGDGYLDQGWVFAQLDGAPLHPTRFRREFVRRVAALGLPPIRLHDLRHTWASLALRAGSTRRSCRSGSDTRRWRSPWISTPTSIGPSTPPPPRPSPGFSGPTRDRPRRRPGPAFSARAGVESTPASAPRAAYPRVCMKRAGFDGSCGLADRSAAGCDGDVHCETCGRRRRRGVTTGVTARGAAAGVTAAARVRILVAALGRAVSPEQIAATSADQPSCSPVRHAPAPLSA